MDAVVVVVVVTLADVVVEDEEEEVVVTVVGLGARLMRTQRQTRRWWLRWQTCTRLVVVRAWPRLAATRLAGTSTHAASAIATRLT
jgi:predicted alpha/beta hydrolase